ncbi:MAG TPA: hypothetical protein VGQ42_06870 [Candidatus Dormibacteraeota bacterium]|jgi:hypothetical protein|nr:hypothetical protein [Candidatus Dormibacteraeota bacterium]
MPLFRRAARTPAPSLEFTVGMRDNRVVVGAAQPGIAHLEELRDYVGRVTGHAQPAADGREPVSVLNARMDFAELIDDDAAVVSLAFEELVARGVIDAAEVPAMPDLPPVPQQSSTYEYIQAVYARAEQRLGWLEAAQEVLCRHGVAVLPPLPPDQA